jgi:predicted Zn-dependent protease
VPLGDVAYEDAELVRAILQEDFPRARVLAVSPLELPAEARHAARGQYDAAQLLFMLGGLTDDPSIRLVAITEPDLHVARLNFVFSAAQPHGNVMVMSFARLRPPAAGGPDLRADRYRKLLRRGLGFTFGLATVPDRACVMSYANSLDELDAKGDAWCGDEAERVEAMFGPGP